MPKPIKANGRYMAGLDGLRALAVLAVISYHLQLDWTPGGLLGVGVFFVLSGYLITDILIAEWKRSGRLNLCDFLLRRARRLLPAMLVMMAGVVGWLAYTDPSRLLSMKEEILSALLYASNWWLIFHEVSYFESFGPSSPLGHFWSLAVEEQFYLLWPLLLVLGLSLIRQRGKLLGLTLAGAGASALAMGLLFEPGTDPSRVYYGTDTRAFGLLIGAALAMVWPSRKLSSSVSAGVRWTLDLVGGAGLLAVVSMMVKMNEYDQFLYQGGLVVLSLATAVVVAVLAHPASTLGKLMGLKPLRWIGVRSYGIYLWHYPVIVLTSPSVNTGGVNVPLALLQVAASVLLAALSWKFIEEPIRHGGLGRLWGRIKGRSGRSRRVAWVTSVAALLVVCLSYAGMTHLFPIATASSSSTDNGSGKTGAEVSNGQVAGAAAAKASGDEKGAKPQGRTESAAADKTGSAKGTQPPASNAAKGKESNQSGGGNNAKGTSPAGGKNGAKDSEHTPAGGVNEPKDKQAPPATGNNASGSDPSTDGQDEKGAINDTNSGSPEGSVTEKTEKTDGAAVLADGHGITVIGDSVILDAEPYLQEMLPGIVVDGKIGRQMSQALEVANRLHAEGKLGKTVALELGSNGAFTKKQMDSLLHTLGKNRQIVLINTRVPRPWESTVNEALKERADSSPQIALIDWHAASANKDEYFVKDGVHLTVEGAKAYASLLANALKDLREID
ncbi:acyltransferase family protein [Brevibacillus borstelensis]|uniref:acyltransferase family protein n=1 Tax=Brevibacillus borstelensis TaxID=45462 RepID=UPI0030C4DB82